MKGSVQPYGKGYRYIFDIDPDPLTGDRRQATKGGYRTEKEAWKACREAMAEYESKQHVVPSRRTVEQLIDESLTRSQHKLKPSNLASYRNYARSYVNPYIGKRIAQDLESDTFDALYDRLLTQGRVKAQGERHKAKTAKKAAQATGRRRGPAPKPRPERPALDPGLSPKTVHNVHLMLHRVWADAVRWRYVKRNVVDEANPPRVPRSKRSTWDIGQMQRFLTFAKEDRFFALWVLELTSGMRRSNLAGVERDGLNRRLGTLDLNATRVVVDGKVIDSDGKSAGSWRTIALDPFTLKLLIEHVEMIEAEKDELGPDYQDHGKLFCWPDGTLPHPDTITRRFQKIAEKAGLPVIKLHEARHSYLTAGRLAKADAKALSQRAGHSSVAFTMTAYMHGDLDADRELADTMARLILPGALGPDLDDEGDQPTS